MRSIIKKILQGKKGKFDLICQSAELNLDFELNKNGLSVLENIFIDREYADYFPFYEKAVIVDIGAHYGYFSLFASKNTQPESQIFAFEPSAQNFQRLKKNLKACQIENILPFQMAVGGQNKTVQLFTGADVNHSVFENYALGNQTQQGESVEMCTLETIFQQQQIDKIDFLKIDCEGGEYPVILESDKSVLEKVDTISMEFHDMKSSQMTPQMLVQKLRDCHFDIVKYEFEKTSMNLNYGKLIGTNRFK